MKSTLKLLTIIFYVVSTDSSGNKVLRTYEGMPKETVITLMQEAHLNYKFVTKSEYDALLKELTAKNLQIGNH